MQISTWRLNTYILKPPMTHSSWHLAFNWFCYASCQIHPVNIHRMVLCLHCDNVITWGPLYWHGLALIPAWISNHMASKVCDKIIYPFPNVNRWSLGMVSSHTLLSKWLLIHVGIKLKHVSKRGALFFYMTHDGVMKWKLLRVTGHLCREFTGPRWFPHTRASEAELWCFLWSASE